MKQVSEVSRRYASALFSLMNEKGRSDQVLSDFRRIRVALSEESSASRVLTAPVISPEAKIEFIDMTFKKAIETDEVTEFLKVLVRKDRIALIMEIIDAYELISDMNNDVERGTVRSAEKLDDSVRSELEATISKRLDKKVLFEYSDDPKVIGGIVAEVGSFLFDGTIDSQIRMLNEELMRGSH